MKQDLYINKKIASLFLEVYFLKYNDISMFKTEMAFKAICEYVINQKTPKYILDENNKMAHALFYKYRVKIKETALADINGQKKKMINADKRRKKEDAEKGINNSNALDFSNIQVNNAKLVLYLDDIETLENMLIKEIDISDHKDKSKDELITAYLILNILSYVRNQEINHKENMLNLVTKDFIKTIDRQSQNYEVSISNLPNKKTPKPTNDTKKDKETLVPTLKLIKSIEYLMFDYCNRDFYYKGDVLMEIMDQNTGEEIAIKDELLIAINSYVAENEDNIKKNGHDIKQYFEVSFEQMQQEMNNKPFNFINMKGQEVEYRYKNKELYQGTELVTNGDRVVQVKEFFIKNYNKIKG